jgi:8-oxo-dGTP pyrophosphatase MutT (NUDIX family)
MPTDEPGPSWVHQGTLRTIEDNWLFRLRVERYQSRLSGRCHDYYVVEMADAVSVIAVTPERRVLLVRQFRCGSGRDGLETPGGLLEPSEAPEVAAARELLEETGHAGGPARVVGTLWSNPALTTSCTTTVVIENVHRVAAPRPDPEEELGLEFVDIAALPGLVRRGAIDNALVVAGLMTWLADEA